MKRMQRPFIGAAVLVLATVAVGCASILGASVTGTLSDNLALASNGAVANKPAFNDGNKFTFDQTTSARVAPDDPNWMEAEKYTVGQVDFPELTELHKIIIRSKDLDKPLSLGMRITFDYQNAEGQWKTLRTWERTPPSKILTINAEIKAKAIRIRIKRPGSMFSGGGGGGGGGGRRSTSDTGVRTIYEIEAYHYVQPEAEAGATDGAGAPQ